MFKFELKKIDEDTLLDWDEIPDLKKKINSEEFDSKSFQTVSTENIKAIVDRTEMFYILKTTTNLKDYNIISITEPFQTKTNVSLDINCNALLQLEFTDIRKKSPDDINNKKLKIFSHNELNLIKEFVLKNKDKPFLINCDAGISRSSAIAIYICLLFNDNEGIEKINSYYRYAPNPLMLELF